VTCALGAPQALEFRRPAVVQPEARKHARKASTSVEHAHAHAHPPAHAHAHPQAPESPAVSGIKRPRVSTGPARALPARAPPLRPEDVPSTAQDERYASRTRDNVAKDAMQPHGFCPVWAGRRQALYAACEYFRNPTQTVGASVQLGSSGIGRGVLLEGNPTIKAFWGTRDETGTIVAAM
jgi:hypothetical protein